MRRLRQGRERCAMREIRSRLWLCPVWQRGFPSNDTKGPSSLRLLRIAYLRLAMWAVSRASDMALHAGSRVPWRDLIPLGFWVLPNGRLRRSGWDDDRQIIGFGADGLLMNSEQLTTSWLSCSSRFNFIAIMFRSITFPVNGAKAACILSAFDVLFLLREVGSGSWRD